MIKSFNILWQWYINCFLDYIYVGYFNNFKGSKGKIVMLNLPAEKIEEEEEAEEDEKNGNFFENEELGLSNKETIKIKPLLQWHYSKVIALEWDKKDKFLVSISESGKMIFSGESKNKEIYSKHESDGKSYILKEIEFCHKINSACINTDKQLIFLGLENGPLVVLCYSNQFQIYEIGCYNLISGESINKMSFGIDKKVLMCQFGENKLIVVRNSWKNIFEELKQFQTDSECNTILIKMTNHIENIRGNYELEFIGCLLYTSPSPRD